MKSAIIKSLIGITLVFGVWWLIRCQCANLTSLTPAALREFIRSFGGFAVLAYIIAYALNTISIVPPIAALSLTAGLAFGKALGALYLMIGAILGTTATFIISRYFGRNLIEKMLKGKFEVLDEKLRQKGFTTILFLRLIPLVPYEIINYAAGLSKMKFKDYFSATFLGIIPGVIVAVFFGSGLGKIMHFKDIFSGKFLVAVGLLFLIITLPVIYRITKKNKANIKCPECSHIQEIEIPENGCLPFYKCENCQSIIRAPKDLCCVICAYSDKKCSVTKF